MTMRKAIVLATDKNYLEKVLVTIKSISVYNRDVDFYLLHQGDVPIEWIRSVDNHLSRLGSSLKNAYVSDTSINSFRTYLTSSTWLRLFTAEIVKEDRAIYLDSDLVVNGSLDSLFEMNLGDAYVAAVKDPNRNEDGNFNAGVLVLNLAQWRKENVTEKLFKTAQEKHAEVRNGDQSILNLVCAGRWLALDKGFNYQTYDAVSRYEHRAYLYKDIGDWTPTIIHFLTTDKPWNGHSVARFRELWWYYFHLEFSQIDGKRETPVTFREAIGIFSRFKKNTFILTNSDQLEHIEYLVEHLPQIQFHVAAYTLVSARLTNLMNFDNVRIYPEIIGARIDKLLDYCDFYLDINHFDELYQITDRAKKAGKKVLAFDNTVHQPDNASEIISHETPQLMVEAILKNA
ncbi:glycosyltransferase family 8 protein [Streptococcus suis]|uniref:glycosyltransferase family 8 protein n=1 Tax=Streptococcus suis TaxID=1307 RepID=UPI002AAB8DE1|nr:glycosyltransferase family 8 protein [Streptococcus suis]